VNFAIVAIECLGVARRVIQHEEANHTSNCRTLDDGRNHQDVPFGCGRRYRARFGPYSLLGPALTLAPLPTDADMATLPDLG
jgi:hypothetical protein